MFVLRPMGASKDAVTDSVACRMHPTGSHEASTHTSIDLRFDPENGAWCDVANSLEAALVTVHLPSSTCTPRDEGREVGTNAPKSDCLNDILSNPCPDSPWDWHIYIR